jgi:integration host factor subunit beta
MTRSELIEKLSQRFPQLPPKAVDAAVRILIDHMAESIASGNRVEIRRFGSFSRQSRAARLGRNPKTGENVLVPKTVIARFRPGKPLRDLVNEGAGTVGVTSSPP